MNYYRTLQSTSADYYPPKIEQCATSFSTKHQRDNYRQQQELDNPQYVRSRVQSYFPCSGYQNLYPEPRMAKERGKRIIPTKLTQMEQILGLYLKQEEKEQFPMMKPRARRILPKQSQVQELFSDLNKNNLNTQNETNPEQTNQQRKRQYPEVCNRPSTSYARQFGFLRTFYNCERETERPRSPSRKKELPGNRNNQIRDINIITLKYCKPLTQPNIDAPKNLSVQKKNFDCHDFEIKLKS